jgi:hypothetical protein
MLHKLDFHGNGFSADLGLSSSQLFKLLWRARHWSLASFPSKGGLPARKKMLSITGMAPLDGLINNTGTSVGAGFVQSFAWSQRKIKKEILLLSSPRSFIPQFLGRHPYSLFVVKQAVAYWNLDCFLHDKQQPVKSKRYKKVDIFC